MTKRLKLVGLRSSKPAGAPTQVVKVSGRLSVAGKRRSTAGGMIVVTGESIRVARAHIDASGATGGGKVLIGGDTGGGKSNPAVAGLSMAALESFAIPTANTVAIDAASTINASARQAGGGGKVVVWADGTTSVLGAISDTGGAISGDGGFVETSAHGKLNFNGSVDFGAVNGASGTWLLDPTDVTIASTGAWVVTPAAIESALGSGNVVVTTLSSGGQAGDITVAENVTWATANTLTLSAYRNISVNAILTSSGAAPIILRADSTGTGIGTVNFGTSAFVQTNGHVSIFFDPTANPSGSNVNPKSYVSPTENFSAHVLSYYPINGGDLTSYMLVNTVFDLQNMQNNLSGTYALGRNVDASATATWNNGAGFVPIGNDNTEFVGVFNGMVRWTPFVGPGAMRIKV